MSEFVWTLIAARTLRIFYKIQIIYKEKVCVWEGIKVDFRKMSIDGMDGISV